MATGGQEVTASAKANAIATAGVVAVVGEARGEETGLSEAIGQNVVAGLMVAKHRKRALVKAAMWALMSPSRVTHRSEWSRALTARRRERKPAKVAVAAVAAEVAVAAVAAVAKAGTKVAAKAVAPVATRQTAHPHHLPPRTKRNVQARKMFQSPSSQPVAWVPPSRSGIHVIPANLVNLVNLVNLASRVRLASVASAAVAAGVGVAGVNVAKQSSRLAQLRSHQMMRRHPPWGQRRK